MAHKKFTRVPENTSIICAYSSLTTNLTLPNMSFFKSILTQAICTTTRINCQNKSDTIPLWYLQSTSVFWISSFVFITKGPYCTTSWSSGSPAIYASRSASVYGDSSETHEIIHTRMKSVLPSTAVTETPVSWLPADRTSVWNGPCVTLASPTLIFPFKAARDTSTN